MLEQQVKPRLIIPSTPEEFNRMVQLWGEKLLMPQEAADYLKYYQENTLAKWRSKKRGPAYIKISDGNIRYRKWDLIDWLNQQVIKPS